MHREYPCSGCGQRRACMFQKLACYELAQHRGDASYVPPHLQTNDRVPSRTIYNICFQHAPRDVPAKGDYFDPFGEERKYLLRD